MLYIFCEGEKNHKYLKFNKKKSEIKSLKTTTAINLERTAITIKAPYVYVCKYMKPIEGVKIK